MSDYKNRTCLVLDNGLFIEISVVLAKSFGKVYYYSNWKSAYPRSVNRLVGTGLPGVTRVNDFWDVLDEVDLFVFPDIYFGGLQEHLVSLGKRVWGARKGDFLELDREKSKEHLDSIGVDIGPYRVVKGIDALRSEEHTS